MAKAPGVSRSTVQRIWDTQGLQPHRITTFKLSREPAFVDKLTHVVGLYLNPLSGQYRPVAPESSRSIGR